MNINSLSSESSFLHTITLNYIKFLIADTLDMSILKIFSTEYSKLLGKTSLRWDLYKIASSAFYAHTNYLLVTQPQQFLLIPFLLRIIPNISIIVTKLAFQLGRIQLNEFHKFVIQWNAIRSNIQDFSAQVQQRINITYHQKLNIELTELTEIYTKTQIDNFLNKCIQVNYYQDFDSEKGLIITAFPSGQALGGAMWQIYCPYTKKKVLFINGISKQHWRVNKSYNLTRIKERIFYDKVEISYIIFTKNAFNKSQFIKNNELKDQQKCLCVMKQLITLIQKRKSVCLSLKRAADFFDIVDYLSMNLTNNCKKIFLLNNSFNKISLYANSYVEYLSPTYSNRIYNDPPLYPLLSFQQLKSKSLIQNGDWAQVAVRNNIPLKELILQNSPFISCYPQYMHYLQSSSQLQWLNSLTETTHVNLDFGNCFGYEQLSQIINELSPECVILYSQQLSSQKMKITSENKTILKYAEYNTMYSLQQNIILNMVQAKGITECLAHRYKSKNDGIQLIPLHDQFKQISKDWTAGLKAFFQFKNILVTQCSDYQVKTEKTKVFMSNNQLKIQAKDKNQVLMLEEWIAKNIKKVKLK